MIRKFPQFRDEDYIPNRPDLYYKDCSGAAPVLAMEFLPDGRRLAVVLTTGMVCLLDTSAGTVLWRYQQPGGTTLGDLTPVRFRPDEAVPLAVAPDGAQLMYTMHTQPVRLLDTETGRLLGEFQGHTRTSLWDLNDAGQPGGVRALAFTPDGLGAVNGGDDGTIRVWRLP